MLTPLALSIDSLNPWLGEFELLIADNISILCLQFTEIDTFSSSSTSTQASWLAWHLEVAFVWNA